MSEDLQAAAETLARAITVADDSMSVAVAITKAFESNAVSNHDGDSANVVDAIAQVGDGLRSIADAIEGLSSTLGRIGGL